MYPKVEMLGHRLSIYLVLENTVRYLPHRLFVATAVESQLMSSFLRQHRVVTVQRQGTQQGCAWKKGCITSVFLLWSLSQHLHLATQMPGKERQLADKPHWGGTGQHHYPDQGVLVSNSWDMGWREKPQRPHPPAQPPLVGKRHLQLHVHLDKDTKLLGIQWGSTNSMAITQP